MNTRTWTPAEIKELLSRNDKAVERALVRLLERQTADEQATEVTRYTNSVGFSAFHAKSGTYMAKWVLSGRPLSGKYLDKARNMTMRYARQLADAANGV